MSDIDLEYIRKIVHSAILEDVGDGDITTEAIVPSGISAHGEFIAVCPCVIAGIPVIKAVYKEIDPELKISGEISDGDYVQAGTVITEVNGSASSILTGERVALNFIQRLSGIATLTSKFVKAVDGTKTVIKDTRKTTPGLRYLEKYAVRVGGGENHRMGLYDAVLIKDNHLKLIRTGSFKNVVAGIRQLHHGVMVEVEAETFDEVKAGIEAGVDVIMLDNMSVDEMRKAVSLAGGRIVIEASGGITLDRVAEVASTGVDWISIGALTTSAPAIDIKLELRR